MRIWIYVTADFRLGPRNMASNFLGPIKRNQRSHEYKFSYITHFSNKRMFHNYRASAINLDLLLLLPFVLLAISISRQAFAFKNQLGIVLNSPYIVLCAEPMTYMGRIFYVYTFCELDFLCAYMLRILCTYILLEWFIFIYAWQACMDHTHEGRDSKITLGSKWDEHTATHCNALQRTVTHCNTLQHTATHYNALQRTATHCNALQHTATHCNTL